MWTPWACLAAILVVAFLLRIGVHVSGAPGGVDTWYYLAYADAVRARPGFDVRLPQYLLQDERQSSPPLFPMLLALLPRAWLLRYFWAISPLLDCLHLALLFWLAYRITANLVVAAVTACVYAFTPQLVSETRSLSPRSFGTLLHSLAMVLAIRYVMSDTPWPWLPLALVAGALLFLASATSSAGYLVVCGALSLWFEDARYALIAAGALAVATLVSGGHFLRVVRNYWQAVAFWRVHRGRFGGHPIQHSPIYGQSAPAPARPGFLGQSPLHEMLRMIGENPFILALPLAPHGVPPWGTRLYVWAVTLVLLALVGTVVPPLRALGPGRGFLKAAAFPIAYVLSLGIATLSGFARPVGVATLVGLAASVGAIAFFYWYTAHRAPEKTASTPLGLAQAAAHLAQLPGEGVLCLPYGYSDYTSYHSGKAVLWGSHCGDLTRLGAIAPVISEPLPGLLERYRVRYLLLDTLYATTTDVGLEQRVSAIGSWGNFSLYELR